MSASQLSKIIDMVKIERRLGRRHTTDAEKTNDLHFDSSAHLKFPQLRQRKAQQEEVREHAYTAHGGSVTQ